MCGSASAARVKLVCIYLPSATKAAVIARSEATWRSLPETVRGPVDGLLRFARNDGKSHARIHPARVENAVGIEARLDAARELHQRLGQRLKHIKLRAKIVRRAHERRVSAAGGDPRAHVRGAGVVPGVDREPHQPPPPA